MKSLSETGKHYAKSGYAVFSMPGHKNKAAFLLPRNACKYDFTELSVTDDLYDSTGGIKNLEDEISRIFESAFSAVSVSGASLCVMAAMGVARRKTDKIIISRFCHSSAVNGMSIFGLTPVWLTQKREGPFYKPLTADEIEEAITKTDAGAVFITTPDYYGTVTDLSEISRVCKKHGRLLIVDNSHGTHFLFYKDHPLKYADVVCDSLHKTLPSLTGTALLHLGRSMEKEVTKAEVKDIMKRLSSTSPSYLLLYSAEKCIEWIKNCGETSYEKTVKRAVGLKNELKALGFEVNLENADPCRLSFSALPFGISGNELYEALLSEKVVLEMQDELSAVAIITPFNTKKDLKRLYKAAAKIAKNGKTPVLPSPKEFYIPKSVKKLGFYESETTERIALSEASGRISAENKYIYPPSRPLLLCGELIDETVISELSAFGEATVAVLAEK